MASKVNWVVVATLLLCYVVAFGLAVAAEEHRSEAVVTFVSLNSTGGNASWIFNYMNQTSSNTTYSGYYYCKYDSDVSSSYGAAAFTFLAIAHVVAMTVTRCLCFDGEHKPGSTRTCAIVSFALLWLCFVIAEICFLAGANKNALRSTSREFVTGHGNIDKYLTCEMMHRGLFGAAAAFTFFAGMAGECYYVGLVLSRSVIGSNWQGRDGSGSGSANLNRPFPRPYALGSEDAAAAERSNTMQNVNLSGQANDNFYGTNRPPGTANRPQTQMAARNPMPSPYALG